MEGNIKAICPLNVFLQELALFSDDNQIRLKKIILNRYRILLNHLARPQDLTRAIPSSVWGLGDEFIDADQVADNMNTHRGSVIFNPRLEYNHTYDSPTTNSGLIDIEGFLVALSYLELNSNKFSGYKIFRCIEGLLDAFDLMIVDVVDSPIYINPADGGLFRSGVSAVLCRPNSPDFDLQTPPLCDDIFLRPAISFDELLNRIRVIVGQLDPCLPKVFALLSRIDSLQNQLNNIGLSVALSIDTTSLSRFAQLSLDVVNAGLGIVHQGDDDHTLSRQQPFFFEDKVLYSTDGRYIFCIFEDTNEYGADIFALTDLTTGKIFLMSRITAS
jgi:hypothetical protein